MEERENAEDRTLSYYDTHADRITSGYEAVDLADTVDRIAAHFARGARILEIGAGSGRDAARLLAAGFSVTAVDGSQAMARRAAALHPELAGRIVVHQLPAALPFADAEFDGVMSLATVMHLPADAIPGVLAECRRVLAPGGALALSVPTARPGLDTSGVDERGRRFTVMTAQRWAGLVHAEGFELLEDWSSDDAAGRPGIRWYTGIWRRR